MLNIAQKIQIFLLFLLFLVWPTCTSAFLGDVKDVYPRTANVFLGWSIPDSKIDELSKWDLLVLDMEVGINGRDQIKRIRSLNPDILILAYISSTEVNSNAWTSELRAEILESISEDWKVKSSNGSLASFWPGTYIMNVTDKCGVKNGRRWNDYLPYFVKNRILSTGVWDGVFYDSAWPAVSWIGGGDLDIDRNGQVPSASSLDKKWSDGLSKLFNKTRELLGSNYLIVANTHSHNPYLPYLNGIMLEKFPSVWEADGTWAGSMRSYFNDSAFQDPEVFLINSNTNNEYRMDDYRKMRFGLGSVLLGDGYYSFDLGEVNHGQTWWYDEYDVNLGRAVSEPYNILDKNNSNWKQGIWRRDFENGIVIVNSTKDNQAYVFDDEIFEKINGSQDRRINNGAKVNMVAMVGEDAVVMQRTVAFEPRVISETKTSVEAEEEKTTKSSASDMIKNKGFNNGAFVRVFNEEGHQVRNGFFTYIDNYPPSSQVLITDIDNDGSEEELVNYRGLVTVYKNGQAISRFQPYEGRFKGEISIAVSDLDGDAVKEIITGAGAGGGPHVRVFNKDGKPLIGGFFAYDKNFRGGVNVAVMDLNGDGTKEIITGAGVGGGPHIRIFSKDGAPLTGGFFAFDKNFRGGARIAVGNTDGAGNKEIIVGSGPGEAPLVRVFTKDGHLKRQFNAYDNNMRDGIMVIAADLDNNGTDEVLAGSLSY